MRPSKITIAAIALLALAACNRDSETKDGLTSKQNADLDNAAAMLDGNQDFDTSPDSLVPEDANMSGMPEPATPVGNAARPVGNGAAPVGNGSAPRR